MDYETAIESIVHLIKAETKKTFNDTYKLNKIYIDYVKATGGCSVKTIKSALSLMFFNTYREYFDEDLLTKIAYILLDIQY